MPKGGNGGGGDSGGGSLTAIKGTRGDDVLVIGESPNIYPDAIVAAGFQIDGWAGNDHLQGGFGADVLIGGAGDDLLVGSLDDLVESTAGGIVYDGGRGNDTLDFSGISEPIGVDLFVDDDRILLGLDLETTGGLDRNVSWTTELPGSIAGIENIIGGSGNDYIVGDWQNNRLEGGAGDDYIQGGAGNDVLIGGAGNDLINVGWGSNLVECGSGNDVFAITGRVVGEYPQNVITDFDTRVDGADAAYDQIWLWEGWSIVWQETSSGPLVGYLFDGGTVFGEVTIENLTYADRDLVPVFNVDSSTGDLIL